MTTEQTAKCLKLISATWINFKPKAETLKAWQVGLGDLEGKEVLPAIHYLIKTHEGHYNDITPSLIRRTVRKLRAAQEENKTATDEWCVFETKLGQEALRRCGGESWFGSLPDPKYAANAGMATAIFHKAFTQFEGEYNRLAGQTEDAELSSAGITHDEAANFLGSTANKRIEGHED